MDVHRFLFSIPLLFLGLFMTIDPIGFVRILGDTSAAIQRFGNELRFGWRSVPVAEMPNGPSKGVRLAGLALTGVSISLLVAAVLRPA